MPRAIPSNRSDWLVSKSICVKDAAPQLRKSLGKSMRLSFMDLAIIREELWTALGPVAHLRDYTLDWSEHGYESSHPRRRARHTHQRRNHGAAKTDGRDRWQTRSLAHHEDLFHARRERFRDLSRLQGLPDQRIFRQLLPAHVRRDLRHDGKPHGCPSRQRGAVTRDFGRHRRRHDDGWPPEARQQLSWR